MDNLVIVKSDAYFPTMYDGAYDRDIAVVQISTASTFEYEATDGTVITVTGVFEYDNGSPIPIMSTALVEKFEVNLTATSVIDLTYEYEQSRLLLEDITGSNSSVYHSAVLDGDTTVELVADMDVFPTQIEEFRSGFAGDGLQGFDLNYGTNDTFNILGSGHFAGDLMLHLGYTNALQVAGQDTFNINRSQAHQVSLIYGDFGMTSWGGSDIRLAKSNDDTIIDTSTNGSETRLVGDVGLAAFNVNVVGGDDTIKGSDAIASTIVGDVYAIHDDEIRTISAGDDTLKGGDQADVIVGDVFDANSTLFNTQDTSAHIIVAGDDIINGGGGNDLIYGDVKTLTHATLSGGDDTIKGAQGNDEIYGQTGDDTLLGQRGNDVISGGSGIDVITGGRGNDTLLGNRGEDTLSGDGGGDFLSGGSGNDILYGGSGTDILNGGRGDDTLYAQKGKDSLAGGAGQDTFVFADNDGNNTISDFNVAGTSEAVDLTDLSSISDWNDLHDDHMFQDGNDVFIDDFSGTTIRLLNTEKSDLTPDEFILT